jgi:hypothetical protein
MEQPLGPPVASRTSAGHGIEVTMFHSASGCLVGPWNACIRTSSIDVGWCPTKGGEKPNGWMTFDASNRSELGYYILCMYVWRPDSSRH